MPATVKYGPGDVRIENVPDSMIIEPTDALVRGKFKAIQGDRVFTPYRITCRSADRITSIEQVT